MEITCADRAGCISYFHAVPEAHWRSPYTEPPILFRIIYSLLIQQFPQLFNILFLRKELPFPIDADAGG